MILISESYRAQNVALHEDARYGTSGHKMAGEVLAIADMFQTRDILDYGCGKQTLQAALGFPVRGYDPCISGMDAEPDPAEFVVCGDVLEHIEPEYLDNVLDDLQRVTKKVAYLIIANKPAKKALPDGRNAHLIQEPVAWWMPKILARFNLISFTTKKTNLHFICVPL